MSTLTNDILADAYGRVAEEVHATVEGLSEEQLCWRPSKRANSIAWLIWHLTRIQDDHLAGLRGATQCWRKEGWAKRFDLPFGVEATGYGQTAHEVAMVRVPADLLLGYFDAVNAETIAFLQKLTPEEYEKVVDASWDPPVTMGVRLVSVLSDCLQHVGQAAYVRGLLQERSS
jgi:uncharacterized damage-inducible protein DinB